LSAGIFGRVVDGDSGLKKERGGKCSPIELSPHIIRFKEPPVAHFLPPSQRLAITFFDAERNLLNWARSSTNQKKTNTAPSPPFPKKEGDVPARGAKLRS